MTGFGRTGPLFVSEQLTEPPDIVCLAKGLSGGFLPLAVTACSEAIFQRFVSESKSKALMHGHSYTANPLACAAALASLDLLLQEECTQQRHMIEQSHRTFANQIAHQPYVRSCRVMGTIFVMEYETEGESFYYNTVRDRLARFFLDRHVLIRPFGNMIHVMPPYCVDKNDLQKIYESIEASGDGS
jgi:adenosylmethionine-8-amino-7-oxononanoate aminotransferase